VIDTVPNCTNVAQRREWVTASAAHKPFPSSSAAVAAATEFVATNDTTIKYVLC
jgi:hypothetical protein